MKSVRWYRSLILWALSVPIWHNHFITSVNSFQPAQNTPGKFPKLQSLYLISKFQSMGATYLPVCREFRVRNSGQDFKLGFRLRIFSPFNFSKSLQMKTCLFLSMGDWKGQNTSVNKNLSDLKSKKIKLVFIVPHSAKSGKNSMFSLQLQAIK